MTPNSLIENCEKELSASPTRMQIALQRRSSEMSIKVAIAVICEEKAVRRARCKIRKTIECIFSRTSD